MARDTRVRQRDPDHPAAVAAGRVLGRAVWDLCAVRGFSDHDWRVCGECAGGGTVDKEGDGGVGGGEEEQ